MISETMKHMAAGTIAFANHLALIATCLIHISSDEKWVPGHLSEKPRSSEVYKGMEEMLYLHHAVNPLTPGKMVHADHSLQRFTLHPPYQTSLVCE